MISSISTAYRLVIISLTVAYRNITHVNILQTADWNQAPQKTVDTNLLFISTSVFDRESLTLPPYSWQIAFTLISEPSDPHSDTSKLLSVNYVCARSCSMRDKKTSSLISQNILLFRLSVFNLTQLEAVIFYCI